MPFLTSCVLKLLKLSPPALKVLALISAFKLSKLPVTFAFKLFNFNSLAFMLAALKFAFKLFKLPLALILILLTLAPLAFKLFALISAFKLLTLPEIFALKLFNLAPLALKLGELKLKSISGFLAVKFFTLPVKFTGELFKLAAPLVMLKALLANAKFKFKLFKLFPMAERAGLVILPEIFGLDVPPLIFNAPVTLPDKLYCDESGIMLATRLMSKSTSFAVKFNLGLFKKLFISPVK